jgi:hypothetical protein
MKNTLPLLYLFIGVNSSRGVLQYAPTYLLAWRTIENLAQDFAARLRLLIAHCLSADIFANQTIHHNENKIPVPLHLLELTQDICKLLPEDTELAYSLAKMQEFMLHHYSNDH